MQFLWHDIRKDDREQCRKELTEEKKTFIPYSTTGGGVVAERREQKKKQKNFFSPFFCCSVSAFL